MFENVTGTWGLGNYKIPDFGFTELLNAANGRNTSNTLTNNPLVYQAVGGVPTAQNTNPWGGGPQPIYSNGITTQQTPDAGAGAVSGGSGGGAAAPVTGGGGGLDFNALLSRQRGAADQLFNQARGMWQSGMDTLGEKRKQFQQVFDQGQGDILQGFEKGAGELQSSATGARERNANALRALGLGGSAVERTQGREKQQEAKGLATLQDSRSTNENSNRNAFQENQTWANSQEAGLNQFLQNAQGARSTAENTLLDNLGGMFNNIINSQMAYNAAMGQKTASPYQVDIPSMLNTLNGVLSSAGLTQGSQVDQNVNINPDQAYLDWKRRTSGGVTGQGLYA
jgi:hypothetical protein